MSLRHLLIVPVLLFAAAVSAQAPTTARAYMMDAQGNRIGVAAFTATKTGVTIELNVTELPPGMHGVHIHAVGKCDGPAFTTAGGHFNPDMKMHGKDNPMGPHDGDLLNFDVAENGTADVKVTAEHVTLGDGPNSLFHPGGTSIVIHAGPDDYKTDPAGNSGARIACGVIESGQFTGR